MYRKPHPTTISVLTDKISCSYANIPRSWGAHLFMIESFSLRTDSGGAGQFRGGLGFTRRYLMLAPCRISTRFERTKCPLWGINGGKEAEPGDVLIEAADETTRSALKEAVMLNAGDRVRIHTGGGGGFGDPRLRDRDSVRTDLLRNYISPEAARTIYAFDEALELSQR